MTGSPADEPDRIAELRAAIGAIESTPKVPSPAVMKPISYHGMPEGEDWMANLPARYVDGQRGFDRRLMEDLAAVGLRCYTVGRLANSIRTMPQGIGVFIDWLTHLDERIPGPETPHRESIRGGLIVGLTDPAARGNPRAVEVLIAQLRHDPPLSAMVTEAAASALATIATASHFARLEPLVERADDRARYWLIKYLGKVKTNAARDIVVGYLDGPTTIVALKALIQMKASGVRHLVAPLVHDPNDDVRTWAAKAMERLPE